jgi:hypothetical protein
MFNIISIEHNENVKYSTKNNKIYSIPVFLAVTNHIRAITISTSNLRLIATMEYIAPSFPSFSLPFRNINRVNAEVNANAEARMRISTGLTVIIPVYCNIAPVKKNERRRIMIVRNCLRNFLKIFFT